MTDHEQDVRVEYEPNARALAVALASVLAARTASGTKRGARWLAAQSRVPTTMPRGVAVLPWVLALVGIGFAAFGPQRVAVRAGYQDVIREENAALRGTAVAAQATANAGGAVAVPTAVATENPADAYAPRPSGAGCRDVPGLSAPVLALCDTIDAAGTEMRLDPRVLAVLVEAECPYPDDAQCVSHAGAFGRAQIMPATAATLAVQTGLPCESSQYDHFTNLRCGARYLTDGMLRASALWRDGRELTAILVGAALYNSGHGRAPEALACVEAGTPLDQCWSLPAETREYVAKWRPLLEAAGYSDAQPVAVAR